MTNTIIDEYKKHVDRTLIRQNLSLTTQQRSEKFERAMALVFELKRVAETRRQARFSQSDHSQG